MCKITPGKRRSARRARARARLRFHLHSRGVRALDLKSLLCIWQTLSGHHSRDPGLLRRVRDAMATLKSPPWKCVDCRRMVKGSVTFCLGCGQHWEGCADRPARSCAQGLQGAVCTGVRPTRAILGKDGNHGFQKTLWRSWSQRKRRWKRQRTSQGTDKESGATQSQGLLGPTGDGTIATTSKPADF